jgi:hypothetical protein
VSGCSVTRTVWLDAERRNLVAAVRYAVEHGEGVHEGGGDGLLSDCSAFLVENDEALFGVEVVES